MGRDTARRWRPVPSSSGRGRRPPVSGPKLLLTDARYQGVLFASLALVTGNLVYTLVFAHLRGTSEIASANLWQLWAMALGPLIVVGLTANREPVPVILLLLAASPSPRWHRW